MAGAEPVTAEEMLMMLPLRRPIMLSDTCFVTNMAPFRFVSMIAWRTFDLMPWMVSSAAMPALFTSTSITPSKASSASLDRSLDLDLVANVAWQCDTALPPILDRRDGLIHHRPGSHVVQIGVDGLRRVQRSDVATRFGERLRVTETLTFRCASDQDLLASEPP